MPIALYARGSADEAEPTITSRPAEKISRQTVQNPACTTRSSDQFQSCMLDKMLRIAISRDQTHLVVQTGLGDQSVGQTRPQPIRKELRPGHCRSLPEAWPDRENWQLTHELGDVIAQSRAAQHLGDNDWEQSQLLPFQRLAGPIHILALISSEECDQRTAVDGDNPRSSRRASRSIDTSTLPRSARSWR